jgi:hypothetical protein
VRTHRADGPAPLVEAMATPAVVVDHVLDVVAWNDAARALFDLDADVGANVARLVLLDRTTRGLLADPDDVAAVVVGHLRLRLAHHRDDPALVRLLGDLAGDDGFRTLWARHDVHDLGPGSLRLRLPGRGAVRMRVDALRRPHAPDETLLTFLPVAEEAAEATARAA